MLRSFRRGVCVRALTSRSAWSWVRASGRQYREPGRVSCCEPGYRPAMTSDLAGELGGLAGSVCGGAIFGLLLWYPARAIAALRRKEWSETRREWARTGAVLGMWLNIAPWTQPNSPKRASAE